MELIYNYLTFGPTTHSNIWAAFVKVYMTIILMIYTVIIIVVHSLPFYNSKRTVYSRRDGLWLLL